MGYINRFLLFIYALVFSVISLGIVVVCLQVIPMYALINELKFVISRQETLIAAGVAFLWGIYLMGCSFNSGSSAPKKEKEIIIIKGTTGIVKVSAEAITNMVEKTAGSLHGVRNVDAKVNAQIKADGSPVVSVDIKTVLSPEQNVVSVSDAIRTAVNHDLENVAGIQEYSVNVIVDDISNEAVSKKKRVV